VILIFFEKMDNADVEMNAKFKSKTKLHMAFLLFRAFFLTQLASSCQNVVKKGPTCFSSGIQSEGSKTLMFLLNRIHLKVFKKFTRSKL
jgi:hypothetical protein